MKYSNVLILFVLLSTPILYSSAQPSITLVERCGTETMFTDEFSFWSMSLESPVKSQIMGEILTTEANASSPVELSALPVSTVSLYDGTVLVSLLPPPLKVYDNEIVVQDGFDRPLIITTTDPRFAQVTVPDAPSSLHWWFLLPETGPGTFAIFGWSSDSTAFMLPVTLTQTSITYGEPQFLPFDFHPTSFTSDFISISPDGNHIAGLQRASTSGLDYFIYSVAERQFVWKTPYDIEGIRSRFLWMPQNSPLVAAITSTQIDQQGILTGIYADGSQALLADLNSVFGDGIDVAYGRGVSPSQILIFLEQQETSANWEGYKIALLDINSNQIVDLCQSTYNPFPVLSEDGQFIVFNGLSGAQTTTSQIHLLELATGNYSILQTNGEIVIPITGKLFELEP